MLNRSRTWMKLELQRVATLEGLEQQDAIRRLFTYAEAQGLEGYALAEFKKGMEVRLTT